MNSVAGSGSLYGRRRQSKGTADADTCAINASEMRWCVGVDLVPWLHQTIAAVCDVRVKQVQFTTRVQASVSAAPFDRHHRVMAGVHVL